MTLFSRPAVALALGLALAGIAPAAQAQEFNDKQKAAIGDIVRDYLVKNPEVLRDALTELDRRAKAEETVQRERALEMMSSQIFESKHQAVIGNPKGKITLVEFFDYNCGYCKKALLDVARLTKEDPDLRVVLKEFPVLGPASVEAAQVASAARSQLQGDKYWAFHQKLLTTRGQIGKAQALAAAKEAGADVEKLEKDMTGADVKAGIAEVMQVADQLALTGTPSWVLGKEVVVGAVGYQELRGKIDNVKKCGKTACG